jgi:5-methyltetrahydrofolate--homocysteine methyltransferase
VKLEQHGIFGKVEEYNMQLVALSRQAADGKAWVAGDIAPTGMLLYPLGNASFSELLEIYTEQAAALEKAGVDLFVIETMMTLAEARAALLAVKSVSAKPVFVSFTCDANGRTLTGSDVMAVLQIMQGMGADAFGLNCSVGPEDMLKQLQRLHSIARIPLIAKPNAGMPEIVDGETVYDCPPERFAACVDEMAKAGVYIYGGCCGTVAEHVSALREASKGLKLPAPQPEHSELLPCATEKEAFFLDPAADHGKVLQCNDELEDELQEVPDDAQMVAIAINAPEDLDIFSDYQYLISKPLCLVCDNAELLDSALALYQGRALYEGSIEEEKLLPLCKKYGLII